MKSNLIPPVVILGANRSGTTMLFNMLSAARDVVGWYEPLTLWRTGHAYRSSDRADARDAKPWVRRRIRRFFQDYQDDHGGRRVVEKTPNNVLRVGFVHAVLPEAKIIHIYRDGRANLRSLMEKYEKFRSYPISASRIPHYVNRLRQTPCWEWPAYVPRALHGIRRTYLSTGPMNVWGCRYPGWREDQRRGLTTHQFAARQWVASVETALHDLKNIPQTQWLSLRYEDVVADPQQWLPKIIDFCDLNVSDDYYARFADYVHQGSVDRWSGELDKSRLDEVLPIMQPLLQRLDYT